MDSGFAASSSLSWDFRPFRGILVVTTSSCKNKMKICALTSAAVRKNLNFFEIKHLTPSQHSVEAPKFY